MEAATSNPKDSTEECFTPLTEDEERQIDLAFEKSQRRKRWVIHRNSGLDITGKMLKRLMPDTELNDEVINAYLELLKERENREPQKFLKCHFFNTFFYTKMTSGGGYQYKSVQTWTTQEKLGYYLLQCDKIFVPIHQKYHWCLAVINNKEKKFQYLDSLKGGDPQVLNTLAMYYVDEVKDKTGEDIDVSLWEREIVRDIPEQKNGFDCGMFVIKYIDFYSRDIRLCFSQEHMPYFRKRTAFELLTHCSDGLPTSFLNRPRRRKDRLPTGKRNRPRPTPKTPSNSQLIQKEQEDESSSERHPIKTRLLSEIYESCNLATLEPRPTPTTPSNSRPTLEELEDESSSEGKPIKTRLLSEIYLATMPL